MNLRVEYKVELSGDATSGKSSISVKSIKKAGDTMGKIVARDFHLDSGVESTIDFGLKRDDLNLTTMQHSTMQ